MEEPNERMLYGRRVVASAQRGRQKVVIGLGENRSSNGYPPPIHLSIHAWADLQKHRIAMKLEIRQPLAAEPTDVHLTANPHLLERPSIRDRRDQ
jgi:hypothetical protein